MKSKLSLAVGVALAVGTAGAQAADSGFYIGAGVGQTTASADTAGAVAVTEFYGATPTSVSTDDSDTTFRALAGYNFNKYVGVELTFADLGDSEIVVSSAGDSVTDTYQFSANGFGLALTGMLPFTDKLLGFGKVGFFMWESEVTANVDFGASGIVSTEVSEEGTDPMVGIGLIWNFTKNLGLRGEYEYIAIDKEEAGAGDYSTIMVNAIFSF